MSAKRLLDLAASVAGLIALAPLYALIALVIRLESRGPVLFRQQRCGRGGEPFTMLKFRTMWRGSEKRGPGLTAAGDPRVTRVGAVLRRLKLDELPQLVNVARGEMSLVGPRPELPEYVACYSATQRAVLGLTPGITDPASLEFFDEERLLAQAEDPESVYLAELVPRKIEVNLRYAASATPWSDLGVIARTLARVGGVLAGGRRSGTPVPPEGRPVVGGEPARTSGTRL